MKKIIAMLLSVVLVYSQTSTVSDTTIIQSDTIQNYGPKQQTIIIQQQNNNNNDYGWNSWSDAGKGWFIAGMVIMTITAIVVPIAIANSYEPYTYDYTY